MPPTIAKRPLRVPKDNRGPVPPATPLDDDESSPPATSEASLAEILETEETEETEEEHGISVAKALNDAQRKKLTLRKLPPIPPRLTLEEFTTYWRQLNPDQKSHLVIYWYRLKPVIDRKMINPDNPNYIDIAATDDQMSLEYMINMHGGGKYHGRVNDTDLRKNSQIADILLEINVSQHEPILNLEELDIIHRDNQVYVNKLKSQGRLTADGRVVRNPSAEAKREENMGSQITTKLLDVVLADRSKPPADNNASMSVITGYIDLLKEQVKQESPQAQLATMLALVKELMPKAPTTDPMQTFIQFQTMLEAQRQASEAKINALQQQVLELASKKEEKPSLVDEIERIKTIAETIGLGSGGGKTSWVDRLIEVAGPALPGVVNIISQRMSANNPQAQANVGIPRMPPDVDTALVPANAQTPTIINENGEEMPFLDTVIANAGNDFINAIANGTTGDQAADAVVSLRGQMMYNMIVKDGKQAILDAMNRNPAFMQMLNRITTPERLSKWLDDFIAYGNEDAEEDEEVAEAPKPKATKPPTKH